MILLYWTSDYILCGLSGKTESPLNNYILNQVIPVFYSIEDYVDYPYEIENRTILDNFKNLRKLTEDC